MIELRDYQTRAIDTARQRIVDGVSRFILQSPTGCHRIGQGILMFDGSIRSVEEIKIGDLLMGPDSTPRRVLSLCRGRQEMARITPNKGTPFVVNLDHVLSLVKTNDRTKLSSTTTDVSVREWMTWTRSKQHSYKLFRVPVKFPETKPPTDDLYHIGILIGSGDHERSIKSECKLSSREARLSLLAGIVDTDWQLNKGCLTYISISKKLSEDVAFVARSVGLAAYISQKKGSYGFRLGKDRTHWRVSMSGDISVIPTKNLKNNAKVRKSKKDILRTGFTTQTLGVEDYYGFTLDGDGRYLLDDFTVTHNSGKTLLAASIIRSAIEKSRRTLFVAHRKELIDQAVDKLVAFGVDAEKIGVIRSKDRRVRPDAPVQVASIASLKNISRYDMVIIDESHRSCAKSYLPLFDYCTEANAEGPTRRRVVIIGLTATPTRTDGKPLNMYEEIVVVAQPSELITAGHIVAPRIFTVPEDMLPDLSAVRIRAGEYSQDELAEAVNKRKLVGSIVDHWIERANGMRTIVFAAGIDHSKAIRDEFLARGVKAEHTDGTLSDTARDGVLARLRSGEIQVACQCDLYIEGLDAPEVRCAVLARPTQSLTVLLQSCGRVMRPYNGESALILDHAGNVRVHGLPTEDRVYSLIGRTKRASGGEVRVKTCPKCYAVLAAQVRECSECGHVFRTTEDRAPEVVEGQLVEVPLDEAAIRRSFWDATARKAHSLGYQRGWASHQYHDRFGVWPPDSYGWPETSIRREANDETRRAELTKLRAIGHRNGRGAVWAEERYQAMFGETPRSLIERETTARDRSARPERTDVTAGLPAPRASEPEDETKELDVGI